MNKLHDDIDKCFGCSHFLLNAKDGQMQRLIFNALFFCNKFEPASIWEKE